MYEYLDTYNILYYRSTYIYAIKLFLPLYASLISVRWTNDEIRFWWYYFSLDRNIHCVILCCCCINYYFFYFIEAIKREAVFGLKMLSFRFPDQADEIRTKTHF